MMQICISEFWSEGKNPQFYIQILKIRWKVLQERTVRAVTACKIALVLRHFIISKVETSSEFIQNQSKS